MVPPGMCHSSGSDVGAAEIWDLTVCKLLNLVPQATMHLRLCGERRLLQHSADLSQALADIALTSGGFRLGTRVKDHQSDLRKGPLLSSVGPLGLQYSTFQL